MLLISIAKLPNRSGSGKRRTKLRDSSTMSLPGTGIREFSKGGLVKGG